MKRFLLPLTAILILAAIAATVAPNIPISQFPIAPVLFTNAWIPIIQPLPGRTTNDNFRVAPSAFAAFLGTNNTSGTNIFNTVIVTNLTIVTNVVFTNVISITTNSITIYTNTYVTNATIFINGTNVAAINPTIGRLPYKSGTNTFDDSSMYFINTNTTGTATLEVTDLANGGVVISLLSGVVTNLSNGTGALTNDGAGNLGWADISGANLWTNNAGILEPVDLTLQPMIQNGLSVGTNTLAFWGSNLTNGEVIVSTSNPDLGDPDSKVIDLSVLNSAVVGTRFNLQLHTNYTRMQNWNKAVPAGTLNLLEWTVDTNEAYLDLQIAGAIRTALRPNTSTSTVPFQVDSALPRYGSAAPIMTFGNYGTNMLSVNWNGGLIFGPGSTNVLYRGIGNTLSYSNGVPTIQLEETGQAATTTLSQLGGIGVLNGGAGLNLTGLGGTWLLATTQFYPGAHGYSFGRADVPVGNFFGTNYVVVGFYDSGSGDNSWLDIHHTGTNGAIILDSQSAGSGGLPRSISFQTNGVERAFIHLDSEQIGVTTAGGVTGGFMQGGTGAFSLISDGTALILHNSAAELQFSSNQLIPSVATMTLGGNGVPFHQVWTDQILLTGITKAQKTALTPIDGMIVYQTDNTPGIRAYINGAWVILSTAADP